MPKNTALDIVMKSAETHGALSEPGHEVGDLQQALTIAWNLMTEEQRWSFYNKTKTEGLQDWAE